ncbi:MAG: hypothetical protein PHY05_01505 [Methanothrix sp.]|nr:hypothetical protein [Methanothrix sp.]
MKTIPSKSAIVLILLLLIACASAVTRVSISESPSLSLYGNGQKAELFTLNKGLTLFNMTYDETSNFAVWLLYPDGDRDLLVNDYGSPFNGSTLVQIDESGLYGLNIEGDGNWTINITQVTLREPS